MDDDILFMFELSTRLLPLPLLLERAERVEGAKGSSERAAPWNWIASERPVLVLNAEPRRDPFGLLLVLHVNRRSLGFGQLRAEIPGKS